MKQTGVGAGQGRLRGSYLGKIIEDNRRVLQPSEPNFVSCLLLQHNKGRGRCVSRLGSHLCYWTSSGLILGECFSVSFSGVLAPPFTPKEAREDLRPTHSGCQDNIMSKSVSLESRGS